MTEEKNEQVIDVSNVPASREEVEILPDDLDGRINIIKKQNNALMKIMDELLEPEVDYGTVPGVDKPFLWQSGAQQLGLVFKFRPVFEIINSTIDWNRNPIFVSYEVKCQLYNKETGVFLGEGVGSANNYERKFKYYWKYPKNGEKYREVFEDPLDKQNTLLKMAKKRAYVDATLNVTGASRLFSQDDDLVPEQDRGHSDSQKDVPPEETIIRFGKHEGKKLSEVPAGYLRWLVKQSFVDEDLKEKANQLLNAPGKSSSKSNGDKRELTEREKEIKAIIGDDKELKKDMLEFLDTYNCKRIDDLGEEEYQVLVGMLKRFASGNVEPEYNPTDEELDESWSD